MNLGDAKRDYQEVLAAFASLVASGQELNEAQTSDAKRQLEAVHKDAMHRIDQFTTRRFLSVNQRRGLITKLEFLHQHAHDKLQEIASGGATPAPG